ncbi:MAG TPA: PilZ domain-containing protein [Sinorhizobium sp.]|nr:PilZ domain-containing protein [Sinorhizobium sp.]
MSWLKALGLTGRSTPSPAPDNDAFVERRAEERRPVFHDAVVVLEDQFQVRAVITNLSSRGARIEYATRVDLPFRVRLSAPTLNLKCWARVVWQHDGSAGLEFPPR